MFVEWLMETIRTNEMMQAALIAAPATALTYAARNIPGRIWNSFKHFFSYDLVFRSDQVEYYQVNKLVCEEVVAEKWSREFAYDHEESWSEKEQVNKTTVSGINIGYGRHWGSYEGTPVIVHREFEEANQSEVFKETLTLSFLGVNNGPARRFCAHVADIINSKEPESRVELRRSQNGCWAQHGFISQRPLNTVFTNDNIKEKALSHVLRFEESRTECLSKGLPWHTGLLLEGPPGGGKTSLIHALASELGRNICFLNLAGVFNDRELPELVGCRRDWHRQLLVLEDIDATGANTERDSEKKGVSLSGLLNILDGFLTPEGLVVIATTNHSDRLDPALLRSGRFDFRAELGPLDWEEAEAMAELLLGPDNQMGSFRDSYVPVMGAELRKAALSGSLNELFTPKL